MENSQNRFILAGGFIAAITALLAFVGAPRGFEDLTIPVWDILLQCNLCTGFVFLVLGVLQTSDVAVPDLRVPLQLLGFAFAGYAFTGGTIAIGLAPSRGIQLFLFTLSLACVLAGWIQLGLAVLREVEAENPNP
jgi:hypothetical protein